MLQLLMDLLRTHLKTFNYISRHLSLLLKFSADLLVRSLELFVLLLNYCLSVYAILVLLIHEPNPIL